MLALIVIAVAALTIGVLLTAAWVGNRIRTVPSDHMGRAQHPDGSAAIDKRSPLNISAPTPLAAAKRRRPALPIRLFVDDPRSFDPEDTHAMGVAFEQACQSLGIADKAAPMAKALAITIIDAGMTGERDAVRLYQAAMRWAPTAA